MCRFLTAHKYTLIVAGVTCCERNIAKRRRVSSDAGRMLLWEVNWR